MVSPCPLNYYSFAVDKLWQDCAMANKKRKPKKFSAVKAVKAMARAQIGMTPGSRVVPDSRKQKTEKHKPTLGKLLEEN
jgi:hypothetical protein